MKKLILMTLFCTIFAFGLYADALYDGFNDIPVDHWAYKSIHSLYKKGYLRGVDKADLIFDGDKPMTRYQVGALLKRVVDTMNKEDKKPLEKMDYNSLVNLKELLLEYSDDICKLQRDVAKISIETMDMKKQMKIVDKQVQKNTGTRKKLEKHTSMSRVNNILQYIAIAALAYKVY
ncbi:S-layer homology domain-containing protein [bacterium]|nr:S-layer homology domain-containing protein [bacterium]